MKTWAVFTAVLLAWSGAWMQCAAQDEAVSSPAPDATSWSAAELDQMLGPIALYPDPLIGVILPAATDPPQIVLSDRYLNEGGDPSQVDQQPWDSSVQGLAHYPTVLKWMDDNLAWTTQVGQAFQNQQADVMDSIQRLRSRAQALGNLQNTPQENVVADDGTIDIEPVSPDEMYVPVYQPDTIFYQPGVYCSFGIGLPIGFWLGFDWDWRRHHLIHWPRGEARPHDWWQRPSGTRRKEFPARDAGVWRPQARSGSLIMKGGDRGYENRVAPRTQVAPRIPPSREARPAVGGTETRRPPEGNRAPAVEPRVPESRAPAVAPRVTEAPRVPEVNRAPPASHPIQRSEPAESAFGGAQSSREVRQSSSRGQESRGSISSGASRSGGTSNRR